MTDGPFGPLPPPLKVPLRSTLDGPRLVVRRYETPTDVEALNDAVLDNIEHLRPFMDWIDNEPRTVAERQALVDLWNAEAAEGGSGVYGAFLGGRLVGSCGLHRRRPDPAVLEVGYWLRSDETAKGYATEITLILTDEALRHEEIERVELYCDDANEASGRVAERAGFELIEVAVDPRGGGFPSSSGLERRYGLAAERFDGAWRERFSS